MVVFASCSPKCPYATYVQLLVTTPPLYEIVHGMMQPARCMRVSLSKDTGLNGRDARAPGRTFTRNSTCKDRAPGQLRLPTRRQGCAARPAARRKHAQEVRSIQPPRSARAAPSAVSSPIPLTGAWPFERSTGWSALASEDVESGDATLDG